MTALTNLELQKFVRSAWNHSSRDRETEVCHVFKDAMVMPALKVNVSSINCRMTTLFTSFASALSGHQMTEPRHVVSIPLGLYKMGMLLMMMDLSPL